MTKEASLEDLKNMKLHEEKNIGSMKILRVPDGWIYSLTFQMAFGDVLGSHKAVQGFITSTFVEEK